MFFCSLSILASEVDCILHEPVFSSCLDYLALEKTAFANSVQSTL